MTRRVGRSRAAGPLTALALTAILLPAVASCTPAPARLPSGVQADVKQYRSDYGPRVLELRMTAGSTPLTITRLALHSPSLSRAAVWRGTTALAARQTVDFRAPLPDARCGAHTAPDPRMDVRFRLADGSTGSATIAATQSIGDLDRIHSLDCTADTASSIAPLRGARLTVAETGRDSVATLHVTVDPTGRAGGYTIVEVRSTVLLAPAGSSATAWPVGVHVGGADSPSEVALPIVPTRCDAHVIAEDKVGTILPVDVRWDDGTAAHAATGTTPSGDPDADGRFPLPLAAGVKSQLLDFVAAHCGLDG